MTVYIAGPLFTQAERTWNLGFAESIARALAGAECVLPQLRAERFMREGGTDFGAIVSDCISCIEDADVVVAILDGSDADSGTSWECGYAYARGKPVVGVRTDLRASEDDGLNAMLRRTCRVVVARPATEISIDALAEAVAGAIRACVALV